MFKNILRSWLKAGIFEKGTVTIDDIGVPQGSIISPTLFNIALNGIEKEILTVRGCFPIRYADDLIV